MPIRPEQRRLYPPPAEWRKIRKAILERAGNACECRGECGHEHDGGAACEGDGRCLAPHGQTLHRYEYDRVRPVGWIDTWDTEPDSGADLEACGVTLRRRALVRVVLTISHRDHDPTHNDEANLRALCQRCQGPGRAPAPHVRRCAVSETCPNCRGTGDTWEHDLDGDYDRVPCRECDGTGEVEE